MKELFNVSTTTWVGTFVNNLDGESVREVLIEAENEVDAIVKLDFYDYDKTWENYSFIDLHKQTSFSFFQAFTALKKTFASFRFIAS